mmetsp:Transcript_14591/g.36299  ORF Transcript_14591/g.36299 Transcript_14591/m.36299 type:complete len:246 (+) Transcript_14591:2248-2985(+)
MFFGACFGDVLQAMMAMQWTNVQHSVYTPASFPHVNITTAPSVRGPCSWAIRTHNMPTFKGNCTVISNHTELELSTGPARQPVYSGCTLLFSTGQPAHQRSHNERHQTLQQDSACASCATSPLSAATSCAVAVCAASSASSLTPSADRVTALLAWSLPAGVELPAAAVAAAAGATAARAAPCSATVADSWSSRSPRLVVAPATWPDSALTAASSACCLALLLAWRDDSWPAMAATAALVADTASS